MYWLIVFSGTIWATPDQMTVRSIAFGPVKLERCYRDAISTLADAMNAHPELQWRGTCWPRPQSTRSGGMELRTIYDFIYLSK